MKKEKKIINEYPYREIETLIFDRFGQHLKTFWCWDYDFSRAMTEVWNNLEETGKFPEKYEISNRKWKADSEMREYQKPLKI